MTTGAHCTEGYPDKTSAKTASRRLRLSRRIDTAPRYCEECACWHITSVDGRINSVDRTVLFKIASGLRAHQIARDIGETESQVVKRVKALMKHFDALSRANLVVLAVFYGVVDPRPIATVDDRIGASHSPAAAPTSRGRRARTPVP